MWLFSLHGRDVRLKYFPSPISSPIHDFIPGFGCIRIRRSYISIRVCAWRSLSRVRNVDRCRTQWIFTLGLSLSSSTDIIITAWLCYFLRNLRGLTGSTMYGFPFVLVVRNADRFCRMIQAIDILIRYTLETGALTW
jgi:hypothetical protein